ncbi:MAG: DUF6580 family putative transport protein [Hyphomicrobiales bacterium]
MFSTTDEPRTPASLRNDLLLIAALVAFDVLARILPHAPGFMPIAASALFAGTVLRWRTLALIVPLAAMFISDAVLGFNDWRMTAVIYVSVSLPALVAFLPKQFRATGMFIPIALVCSLIFFATTNFAVWAFSGMYTHDLDGLIKCYVLALPFLQNAIAGDLFWVVILFGAAWLVRMLPAYSRRAI